MQENARLLPQQAQELGSIAGQAFAVIKRAAEARAGIVRDLHRVRPQALRDSIEGLAAPQQDVDPPKSCLYHLAQSAAF